MKTLVSVEAVKTSKNAKTKEIVSKSSTLVTSWLLFALAVGPFVTDLLFVRLRAVRFPFQGDATDALISSERKQVYVTIAITAAVATFFAIWAKRGVAFPNLWSSWRTSRSVESLQYEQLPYDNVEGSEYDDWNAFLPAHGFDTVWSRDEMMKLEESDLGIMSDECKTKEQSDRVIQGEAKKPLFLTHYTISSHIPFQERPKWYADADKPDFSALYEGEEYADLIRNYLEMRYFTDVELGKFMDRMEAEGILNDTIVVIVGDHGQAPEYGYDIPEARDLSATRVAGALIAEGRLGEFVGLRIEDAAEQYDMLNTLADITGVPEGGFLQDGVGRSLKRNVTFGERVVFSNNPNRKMSVVRGNERLQYDRYSGTVLLHNTYTDHDMQRDLFSDRSSEEKANWLAWRYSGRWLNSHYTDRWDKKCLLGIEC
ncbi:hypothetical protein BBJ29_003520 [Phytophthora kernoviae]|uniref:Sulfatase N-terminal domain-containing protein n=1 Tax=Phytophthora kernoviae TaxID=325452 RepID=A0A3F2RLK4_9STRA|nr:hypothetical protein BBJ29_003520 [Phytophthora kernoviae]RLN59862.1 hypothetical protein BBP00_00006287 [Phytophthora kernoviae]